MDELRPALLGVMRHWRSLLLVAALVFTPGRARGQQQPTYGCHASTSCQPLGFSSINGNFGTGASALFGFGFRWDPGFQFYIAGPQDILLAPKPTPVDGQIFHLRIAMLPPPASPTPTPTPLLAPPPTGQDRSNVDRE